MGSAAAWALTEAGRDVVVLERFTAGHDRGGSHGQTRLFRLVYDTVDYIGLAKQALSQWRRLEALTGKVLLETTGGVEHGMSPAALRVLLEALAAEHVKAEVIDALEAGRRWPGMRFVEPVLFQPDAGRLKAADAIAAFQELATKAEFRYEQKVERIDALGDNVDVHTASGTIRASRVIVAAGPWTPALVGKLSALRVTQEQPRHFQTLSDDLAWPNFVHWRKDGFDTYGLLAPGEGVKVGFHAGGPVVDPDARDFQSEPAADRALRAYVREWFPGLDAQDSTPVSCLYDNTASSDFMIDQRGPVTIAAGFSGHGFKFAPAIGRLLAGMALGRASTLDRFAMAARVQP
jgi:sarcosine oxidase